jgi:hypothetical protein
MTIDLGGYEVTPLVSMSIEVDSSIRIRGLANQKDTTDNTSDRTAMEVVSISAD